MKRLETILALVLLAATVAFAGCEISQVSPTAPPIDIRITAPMPGEEPEPDMPAGPTGTIILEPSSLSVSVGSNVNVKVIVRDENGQEKPSQNISVNVIDKTILTLVEIDGRILAFGGLAAGTTSVIVSASGLQTSLVASVTP